MKKFNNIEIHPYTELLDNPFGQSFHKGGPIWPDWENQSDIRHIIGGRTVDSKPEKSNLVTTVINETLFWCGAITEHFGHQITDFSSRIAMYKGMEGKLCFSVHPRSQIIRFEDCPKFFQEIIHTLGFNADDIFIVSKPIVARLLYCSPQQEHLGGGAPSPNYLDVLDTINPSLLREERQGLYYISRAGQKTGRVAGESYIESYLGLNGYKVIRPESISLKEQLRIYKSAKKLIFCEGSAVHGLQLIGRNPVDVTILNRRKNYKIAKNLLLQRVYSLNYFDMGELIYGLNRSGNEATEVGICFPNKKNIVGFLEANNIPTSNFNFDLFWEICTNDLTTWVKNEKNSPRNSENSTKLISIKIKEIVGIEINITT